MTSICGICGEVSYCMYCSGEGCNNCDPVCICLQQIDITFKRTSYVSFKSPLAVQLPKPPATWLNK